MKNYKLIRSNRKSLSIKITENGSLEVRSPMDFPKEEIDKIIDSRKEEIAKHSKIFKNKHKVRNDFKLNFGNSVILRGEKNYISPIGDDFASYDEKKKKFFIPKDSSPEIIKNIIIELYKLIAKSYITKRVMHFKKIMNIEPSNIRITSAKTRWGSCSNKNSLNFSWRLIMADDSTIDYVVVHELSHIKEHNHSKEFWKIVESIIPDYKINIDKLKNLSEKLSLENWDN